jgi:hypothetical protein
LISSEEQRLKKEAESPIICDSPMISHYEVPPDVAGRIPNIVAKIDQ